MLYNAVVLVANILLTALFTVFAPINLITNYVQMESEWGLETSLEQHGKRVEDIVRQVKQWMRRGKGQKMTSARPSWKTICLSKLDKSKYFKVRVDLNSIIGIDEKNRTVTVEPGVMMGQISRYLFKRGWTIPVIPEMECASVGGSIAGLAGQTSCHKYGFFHDTCLSYEVVLPTGEVVTCTKDKDPDLFYAIPGSCGTIGFITAVTIRILPATRYIRHEYRLVSSLQEFQHLHKSEVPRHDFVEGLAFTKDKIIIMFGDFHNGPPTSSLPLHNINRWYKQPFYKLVESIMNKELSSSSTHTELIPLIDYYHRYSRGFFWLIPKIVPFFNSKLFLFFFGWILPINLHCQRLLPNFIWRYVSSGQVVQDYGVPWSKAVEFFNAGDKYLKVYPVWLCPVTFVKTPCIFPCAENGDYIDIAFFSYPEAQGFDRVKNQRAIEDLLIKMKGGQLFYADMFMSGQQFREMYDTSWYDRVRKERGLDTAFPDIYDKIGPKGRGLDKLLKLKES